MSILHETLVAQAARIKELERSLGWLIGEILRDHDLERLSIDSEDCAKAALEVLSK